MRSLKGLSIFFGTVLSGLTLLSASALAVSMAADKFEGYALGSINGQGGWSSLGSAGLGCALYDHAVSSSLGTPGFGTKSLRISNGVTSGCFGDQTFSKSLVEEAGETSAQNGGMSSGARQRHFDAQFSLKTTKNSYQPGLMFSVSPDRGDGARMSYLRFEDQADGVHVFFDDYQDIAPFGGSVGDPVGCGAEDNFFENDIATLSRKKVHNIRFSIDFVDGERNDVVKIFVDGKHKITGTSWEDYFRYCENNPTRTVDSLLFRTGGTAAPATAGQGFLIDNLKMTSRPVAKAHNDHNEHEEHENEGHHEHENEHRRGHHRQDD